MAEENAAELQRITNIDWPAKSNAEVYFEVKNLIDDIEHGRKGRDFLSPFRIGFANYMERLTRRVGGDLNVAFFIGTSPHFSGGEIHNLPTIRLIEFRAEEDLQYVVTELQSNELTMPIMLAEMAKVWPNREVFVPNGLNRAPKPWDHLTLFQQLVATPGERAREEVIALLNNNDIRNRLALDSSKNTPFAFVKNSAMLDALVNSEGINNAQTICKINTNENKIHTLGCAIRRHASLEVITALIQNGADPSVAEVWPDVNNLYPVSVAARHTDNVAVYNYLKEQSPEILAHRENRKFTFFISLKNPRLRIAQSILADDNNEFVADTYLGKGTLQYLLSKRARALNTSNVAYNIFTTLLNNQAPLLGAQGGFVSASHNGKLTLFAWAAKNNDAAVLDALIIRANNDNNCIQAVNEKSEQPEKTAIQILLDNATINISRRETAIKLIDSGADLIGQNAVIKRHGEQLRLLAHAAKNADQEIVDAILRKAEENGNLAAVVNERSEQPEKTAMQILLDNATINSSIRATAIKLINSGAELIGENALIQTRGCRRNIPLAHLAVLKQKPNLLLGVLNKAQESGVINEVLAARSMEHNLTPLQLALNEYRSLNEERRGINRSLLEKDARVDENFLNDQRQKVREGYNQLLQQVLAQ